jgi:type II secretory pathway pseudopilin PulG
MKRTCPKIGAACRKDRSGSEAFTFVEVFAAMVFLAILIPAIVEGLSIANRTSVVAERSSIAGELAENKLNEILLSSTGGAATAALDSSGDFGTDWPGYRWEMSQDTWDQDTVNTMSEVSVQVFYPVQGHERSVTLATLVSGTAQEQ